MFKCQNESFDFKDVIQIHLNIYPVSSVNKFLNAGCKNRCWLLFKPLTNDKMHLVTSPSDRHSVHLEFLQHSIKLALQALYMVYANPTVCLSVRHTPVLCQNEGTQMDIVFTIR